MHDQLSRPSSLGHSTLKSKSGFTIIEISHHLPETKDMNIQGLSGLFAVGCRFLSGPGCVSNPGEAVDLRNKVEEVVVRIWHIVGQGQISAPKITRSLVKAVNRESAEGVPGCSGRFHVLETI